MDYKISEKELDKDLQDKINESVLQCKTIPQQYVEYETFLEATKIPVESCLNNTRESTVINPLNSYNYVSGNIANKNTLTTINSGEKIFNPYADIQIKDNVINNKNTRDVVKELYNKLYNDSGSWTPCILGATKTGGVKYLYRYGTYKKIGTRIFLEGWIQLENKGDELKGNIVIGGLPFKSIDKPYITYGVSFGKVQGVSNITNLIGMLPDGDNRIYLYNSNNPITQDSLNNNLILAFSLNYEIKK